MEPRQRQRAERVEVRNARDALSIVVPVNRKIGPWQSQAARLVAFGTRLRLVGRSEPRLSAEAEALASAIRRQREELAAEARNLPPEIGEHGRVRDTLRALDTVFAAVTQARALLDGGPSGRAI
jgi:hypothetical protein